MNKIKQQYDEFRVREHYQGLLDGGMSEEQANTKMMYDSPFSMENVDTFFQDLKKKENPLEVPGSAPVTNKTNQNLSGGSTLGSELGDTPSPSKSKAQSASGSDEPETIYIDPNVPSLLEALEGIESRPTDPKIKKPELGRYTTAVVEEAMTPFFTFEGALIGSPEIEASMNVFDIFDPTYEDAVNKMIEERYPKSAATINALKNSIDNFTATQQDRQNYEYLRGMTIGVAIKQSVTEKMKKRFSGINEDQQRFAEQEVFKQFGLMIDLNDDGVVGETTSSMHDSHNALVVGFLNFQHNMKTLGFNIMAGIDEMMPESIKGGEDFNEITFPEWVSNFVVPGDPNIPMTRAQMEKATDNFLTDFRSVRQVPYMSNVERSYAEIGTAGPFNRETLLKTIESAPQSAYWMGLSMYLGGKSLFTTSMSGKGVPFLVSTFGMGAMVYSDTYNHTLNDESFYKYTDPDGNVVPKSEAVEFLGGLKEGYTRFHDEVMAQGYSSMMGLNEGVSEGAGLVTFGFLGGAIGKAMTNPFARTALERWIAGSMMAMGVEGVSEMAEEQLAEIGQFVIDKVVKEKRPLTEIGEWLASDELYDRRTEAGNVGFLSGLAMGGGVTSVQNVSNVYKANAVLEKIETAINNEQQVLARMESDEVTFDLATEGNQEARNQIIADQEALAKARQDKRDAQIESIGIVLNLGNELSTMSGNRQKLNEIVSSIHKSGGAQRQALLIKLREELGNVKEEEYANYELLSSAFDLLNNNKEFSPELASIVTTLIEDVRAAKVFRSANMRAGAASPIVESELSTINQRISDTMKTLEKYMEGAGVEYTLILPGETVTDATTITKVSASGDTRTILTQQTGPETVEAGAEETEETEDRYVFEDSKAVELLGGRVMSEEQRAEVSKLMDNLEGNYRVVFHKNRNALGAGVSALARMNEQGEIFEIHLTPGSSVRDIQEEFIHTRYDAALREDSTLRSTLVEQINSLAERNEELRDAVRRYSVGYSDVTDSQREREIITNLLIDLADGSLSAGLKQDVLKIFNMSNAQELLNMVDETKGLLTGKRRQESARVTERSKELIEAVETEENSGMAARGEKYDPEWIKGKEVIFNLYYNGRTDQYKARVKDYGHFRNLWVRVTGNGQRQMGIVVESDQGYTMLRDMPGHSRGHNQPLNWYGSGPFVRKDKETGEVVKVEPMPFSFHDKLTERRQREAEQERQRKQRLKEREQTLYDAARDLGYFNLDEVAPRITTDSWYGGSRTGEELDLIEATLLKERGVMVIPNMVDEVFDIPMRAETFDPRGLSKARRGYEQRPGLLQARELDMDSNQLQEMTWPELIDWMRSNAPDPSRPHGGIHVMVTDYSPTRSGDPAKAYYYLPSGVRKKLKKGKYFMTTGVGYQDQTFSEEGFKVVSSHVTNSNSAGKVERIEAAEINNQWVVISPRMLTHESNGGDPGLYRATVSAVYEMFLNAAADIESHPNFMVSKGRLVSVDQIMINTVEGIINQTTKKETIVRVEAEEVTEGEEAPKSKTKKQQRDSRTGEEILMRYWAENYMPQGRGDTFNREKLTMYGFIIDEKTGDILVDPRQTKQLGKGVSIPLAVYETFNLLMSESFYHDSNASFQARKLISDVLTKRSDTKGGLSGLRTENGQYIFDSKSSNNGSLKDWRDENFGLKEGKDFEPLKSHRAYVIDPTKTVRNDTNNDGRYINGKKAKGHRVDYRYQVQAERAAMVELTDRPGLQELKDESYDSSASYPGADFIYQGLNARRLGRITQEGGDHWSPSEPTPFGAVMDAISIKLQDKYSDIIHLQRDVEGYRNQRATQNQDFNLAVDLMYGKNRNDLEFLEGYLGEIKDYMSLNKISSDNLSNYLYARHAQERNSFIASRRDDLDSGSGMSNDEAIQLLNDLDSREMRELADMVYAIIEDTRKTYIDFGLETRETVDAWRSLYDFYVPLQGLSTDEADSQTTSYPTGGAGMSVYGSMSRKAKGRKGKTEVNIVAQVVMQNAMAHTAARKNEALRSMYELVKKNPNNEVWRIYNEQNPMMRTDMDGKQRAMSVAEMRASQNVVPVRIDGKQEFIHFKDPSYARTLNGMSIDQQNILTRALRVPAGFLRNVFTIYDPNFFVSNFARDIQAAIYNATAEAEQQNGAVFGVSSAQMAKDVISNTSIALRAMLNQAAFGKDMSPEMAAIIEEWKAMGGQTGWGYHDDIEAITKGLAAATQDQTLRQKIFSTPKAFFTYVEGINEAFENSIRLAAYMSAKKNGATPERAAQLAKNITVNFNRSGEWGTTLNSIYLFFNAAMQGNARLLKSMVMGKDQPIQVTDQDVTWINRVSTPQKIAFGMTMFSGMQTMINLALSGTDEDGELWYNKIPDYEKERNIIIMAPNGKNYFKIPLPYGYNIFNNLGVTIAETSSGHRDVDEAFLFMGTSAFSSFSPISFGQSSNAVDYMTKAAVPTALKPFVEVGYNETYFGSQVYQKQFPFGTQRPESELAFRSPEWMQELFVTINEMTGGSKYKSGSVDINPDPYWYLFEYFIGGAGKFVNQSGSLAVDGYRTANAVIDDVSNAQNPDEAFDAIMNPDNYADINLTKVPIIKRMYGEASRYYDFDLYEENMNTIMQLEKERREQPKPDAAERYKGVSMLASRVKDAEKLMKRIRDMKSKARDIQDPLERARRINELMEQERLTMVRFNKMYNEIRGEN